MYQEKQQRLRLAIVACGCGILSGGLYHLFAAFGGGDPYLLLGGSLINGSAGLASTGAYAEVVSRLPPLLDTLIHR